MNGMNFEEWQALMRAQRNGGTSSEIHNHEAVISKNDASTKYNPSDKPEYVEIAGVKWGLKNVGAESVTDVGLYFQWGDGEGFTSENPKGEDDYNTDIENKYVQYEYFELLLEDDMATINLGENWKTPSNSDFESLIENTNVTFIEDYQDSGTSGYLFTDKQNSSKTLFLPIGGVTADDYSDYYDNWATSWSGSRASDSDFCAIMFGLYSTDVGAELSGYLPWWGAPVRPIYVG